MIQVVKDRLEWLKNISLARGQHGSIDAGACAMEAAAYVAGEQHSDHPTCVCPVIGQFMRSWNDALRSDDERDRLLKPLLLKILGTSSTPEVEHRRSLIALDWLIRTHTAAWLDTVEALKPHAAALRDSPPIDDENAAAIGEKVSAAESAAWSAWSAAESAAESAALKVLEPTIEKLQLSAIELVERMIELGE